MAAVFAFGKRGANNSAPVSNYLISKGFDFDGVKLIFDSWGRVAARKLLILLVWGTDFSKV